MLNAIVFANQQILRVMIVVDSVRCNFVIKYHTYAPPITLTIDVRRKRVKFYNFAKVSRGNELVFCYATLSELYSPINRRHVIWISSFELKNYRTIQHCQAPTQALALSLSCCMRTGKKRNKGGWLQQALHCCLNLHNLEDLSARDTFDKDYFKF